jgi:hypothetical protein
LAFEVRGEDTVTVTFVPKAGVVDVVNELSVEYTNVATVQMTIVYNGLVLPNVSP